MATAEQLKALVRSYAEGDQAQFLSVAMQVAAHAAKQGHSKLAQELRSLVDQVKTKSQIAPRRLEPPTPLTQPRGELAGLLSVSYPSTRLNEMVLQPAVGERLERVLREHKQGHKLREHGLRPRHRMLLVGPPGSGKTMTAAALAGEMQLPLFTIVLDGLITKFMGETAAKLRLVFDAIRSTRGVYLFDEFDAIGGQRGASNDVGEIRRVLNSFLQFLEQDQSDSLIISATNHPELLDHALFRRFDDVIEYNTPSGELANRTILAKLGTFTSDELDWKQLSASAAELSYAELARACNDAIKEAILDDKSVVTTQGILRAFEERRATRRS
ncbi:ATP-binding protein [Stigmatella sp. ncwal1]|uniref:ATP-binding protein n=1 Tax=Stigmatella ashevillensis TaxID=2995309 RepID=A0ABT5DF80_9BACT|nr:ATP-binding protein [Stigmatella ashevillena]MDC0711001.1 ATP-binding protein [Stigmatella ashevillena]